MNPGIICTSSVHILLVEKDLVCVTLIVKMLRKCLYKVTTCETANMAVTMILEKQGCFDLVLSDVYTADTNSLKLLQSIGMEMDIPLIMMSIEKQRDAVLEGVIRGACDYLIKPVRMVQLQNIWQHVVRKKQREWKQPESMEDREQNQMRALEEGGNYSPGCEGGLNGDFRKKDEVPADPPQVKKRRFVWTPACHGKFLKAFYDLGSDKAVPKKILERMNDPSITRDNVASHLQKYRANKKKNRRPEDRSNSTFLDNQEMAALAGVERLNFQAPSAYSPNLPQTLAAPQAGPSRTISSYMDMSNIGFDARAAFASTQLPAPVPQVNNVPFSYFNGVPDNTNLMQYEHPWPVIQPRIRLPAHVGGETVGLVGLSSSQVASFSFPGDPIGEQPNNNPLMVIEEDDQAFFLPLGTHMDCQDQEMEDMDQHFQSFSRPLMFKDLMRHFPGGWPR